MPSAEGTARAKVLGQEMFGALQGLGVTTAFLLLVGRGTWDGWQLPRPAASWETG